MSKKILTDEKLEEIGKMIDAMHKTNTDLYGEVLKTMPLNSKMARTLFAAGRAVQRARFELEEEAERRQWSYERVQTTFPTRIYCTFR